ncbi:LamG-like jellyroll fold domain-containing protein [Congregibacter variabilis]|uniref:LamG-like jellyroll fold domain-containing protein n=1 Tax=Congregibacter variabilis TaxID=3081200 RepID=A0ABZ0HYQ9_9GAMM|nr:LamG-like jellyroll fold domain-containing protein [Congregibacter sp. IMCC43200]
MRKSTSDSTILRHVCGTLLTIGLGLGFSSVASAGLIHLWEANGDATDSVGGVDGTLAAGVTYAAGFDGQAFSFDGQGGLFSANVDISPSNFGAITFGAWVNIASVPNNRGWVIGHDNGGYDRSISLHDSRFSGSNIKPAAGVGKTYTSTLADLTLNEWKFVAASYQGNGQTTTVYFDGQSQEVLGTNNSNGNSFFTVGGLSTYAGHQINGLVDNIFIYDRALSVAELRNIEANGLPVPAPATLALIGLGLAGLGWQRRRS